MWTPIRLLDETTGRYLHITLLEYELYLDGFFNFEILWEMRQPIEGQLELLEVVGV